ELLGNDVKERALAYQWSLWAITNLQPNVLTIMLHSALLPEAQRSAQALATGKASASALLGQLDGELSGTEYLVGGRFTVADVNVASVANFARAVGAVSPEQANVTRYVERMHARPAYARAVAA